MCRLLDKETRGRIDMMHDVRWEELEEVTTDHARKRMNQRGITTAAIDLALRYGLADYRNGALRYTIGRKESARYRDIEPRLVRYHGVHVVCASDGEIGRASCRGRG